MESRMGRPSTGPYGKERDRLKVVGPLAEGRLKQVEAARLLRLSVRQVRRLLGRYRAEGDAGLVHRSRGRPSNRRIPEVTRRRVMALVRRHYADFSPTLASEKLAERDGIEVSREWLRQRMIEAHLRTVRRRRVRHHTWRQRRPCFGELVQMDMSEHAWLVKLRWQGRYLRYHRVLPRPKTTTTTTSTRETTKDRRRVAASASVPSASAATRRPKGKPSPGTPRPR